MQVLIQILVAIFLAILGAEMQAHGDDIHGSAKTDLALKFLDRALVPLAPAWVLPVVNTCLPFLIEAAVRVANRSGLFRRLYEVIGMAIPPAGPPPGPAAMGGSLTVPTTPNQVH